MNSNEQSKKFSENLEWLNENIKQMNKELIKITEKQLKQLDSSFGNKIKIKENRRIIFKARIENFGVSSNNETIILKLKGIEQFQNEKLIILLPKNKKMHKDTKGYVVFEI